MDPKRLLTALAVLAATAILAAAAGAEPKNQWPFTRPVSSRVLAQIVTTVRAAAVPAGERKNEAPFTNRVSADPGYAAALHEISSYYAGSQRSAVIRPGGGNVAEVSGHAFGETAPTLLAAVILALGATGLVVARRRSLRVS